MAFNPFLNFADLMILFIIIEDIGLVIFAFYWLIFRDRNKHFFLYFDSDKSCTLETKKVTDGFAKFKNKYFYVDWAKPLNYFRSFGFQNPLLFLKWDDVIPVDVIRKTVKPYLMTNKDENFNMLTENKFNNNLKKKIQSDPEFKKKLDAHEKYLKENPDKITKLDLEIFDEIQKENPDKSQSLNLREKLTPETLKKVVDSGIIPKF